jgi:hypothetical protein
MTIPEVARLAGVEVQEERLLLVEAPRSLAGLLAGARQGEAVGPIGDEVGISVWQVRERRTPDPSDPLIASRAREELIEEAMSRRRAGRVRWHELL